jgi:hypothetical protein
MSERDRILDQIEAAIESLNPGYGESDGWYSRRIAEAALAVIEKPESTTVQDIKTCTCSNTGYSTAHTKECPLG